jgi:protein-tyrosine-phosphatase
VGVGRYARAIDPDRLLLLCTANQCRSPMAEGLLRRRLDDLGIDAEVRSAGVLPGGVAASKPAVQVLSARGIDLSTHRSRTMAADEIAAADLVIGMERNHVREAIVLVPEAKNYAFTLRDVVRRAWSSEPRRPGEALRAWASRLAEGRTTGDLLGAGDDAIADPMGGTRAMYEHTAAELDDLLGRLVERAYGEAVAA